MNETLEEFYNHLLGIESPWEVTSIQRNSQTREVTALVGFKENEPLLCPECDEAGAGELGRKELPIYSGV